MKQPAKTQTGPLYPNLWAEAQYNAKPWAMASRINATEEVVVKIIWGKEPLHMDEATALASYLGPDPDHAYLWAYQTFRQALVEPVTMAQYLEALDWMKSAKSTVQAEKTKRR